MQPLKLHPYQVEAVAAVKSEFARHKSTLLAMSTGTGKTIAFLSWLNDAIQPHQRALIIAHRRELIHQPMARMRKFYPDLYPRAGIVMGSRRDVDADVVVATVQSLNSSNRINEILAHGAIDYTVTDEAHHGPADSYVSLYDRLYEANPNMRHLGCTATPRRADDVALKQVFESVAYRLPLNKAIEIGALVPFVAMGFYVPTVKLDHIPQFRGDWSDKAVGEVMTERAVLDAAVATWKERAEGRPTIAFCATIQQAHLMAQWFNAAGVPAEAADYKTPKARRAAMLKRFERGETLVLCNAMLWTEGVDLPLAEVALMLRPTQSDSLYVQMVGRVLRTWKGKKSALILDLVPAGARNMIMAGDILDGVPRPQRKAEQAAEQAGIISCFGFNRKGQGIDADPDEIFMKVLDYLKASTLAWKTDGRLHTCGLSDTRTLCVVGPDPDRIAKAEALMNTDKWCDAYQRRYDEINVHRVFLIEQEVNFATGKKGAKSVRKLGTFPTWADTVPVTEEFAAEHQDRILSQKKKRWRRLGPTVKQADLARRLGIRVTSAMKRGDVATEITHYFARDFLKRKRLLV